MPAAQVPTAQGVLAFLPCADDDAAQAVVAKWNADVNLPTLVPGGIQQGKLSSWQPNAAEYEPATGKQPAGSMGATGTAAVGNASAIQSQQAQGLRKMPYAGFDVTVSRPGIHQTTTGLYDYYLDFRLVVIEIRGLKPAVANVMAYLRQTQPGVPLSGLFNRQTLATQATFIGCVQAEADDLREDPAPKAGEDIWIGTVRFEVWTQRPE